MKLKIGTDKMESDLKMTRPRPGGGERSDLGFIVSPKFYRLSHLAQYNSLVFVSVSHNIEIKNFLYLIYRRIR